MRDTRFFIGVTLKALLVAAMSAAGITVFSQVNQQTGAAVFDMPIFNYQDNVSNLSLPVSLGYNSAYGLKVDEVASDVGQGWGLMAGGKIARVQVGEPDDQKPSGGEGAAESTTTTSLSKYPAGYLYTGQNPQLGVPVNYNKYPVYKEKNQTYRQHNILNADRELDYFMMNVNGISLTFVLDKATFNSNTGVGQGFCLGISHMKVAFYCASGTYQDVTGVSGGRARTMINKFVVTDGNGLEYEFTTMAYNKLLRLQPCDLTFENKVAPPKKFKKGKVYNETYFDDANVQNPYVVTEWYLTEIRDKFVTTRKIVFGYDYRHLNMFTGFDYNLVDNLDKSADYGKRVAKRAIYSVPVVKLINCNNNEYSINFGYDAPRLDMELGKPGSGHSGSSSLTSIRVEYRGRPIQKHILKQSYVIYTRYGTPVNNEQKWASRLFLISVTKQTVDLKDEERPYVFDYHLGGGNRAEFVPPPYFASKDIWGYYDGFQSLLGDASGNTSGISAGLKSYCVTGARGRNDTHFPDYSQIERISFRNPAELLKLRDNYASLGLLKSVQYPAGGRLEYEYGQNIGKLSGIGADQKIGGVHVTRTTVFDGGYSNNCTVPNKGINTSYTFKNADGSSSLWGAEMPLNYYEASSAYKPFDKKFTLTKFWLKPKCTYGFQFPGIAYSDEALSVSGFQKFMSSSAVRGVSDVLGAVSTVMNIVTVVKYGLTTTGVGAIVSLVIDALMTIFDAVFTCWVQDDLKVTRLGTWYNKDLRASNPLPLLYKRVEVAEGTGNGKTAYEFTSNEQYPVWVASNPWSNMQQRYGSWLYGLPKKTTMYDASNIKVREVENEYKATTCQTEQGFETYEPDMPYAPNGEGQNDIVRRSGPNVGDDHRYFAVITVCDFGKIPLERYSCNILTKRSLPVKSTDWAGYYLNVTHTTSPTFTELYAGVYDVYTGKLQLSTTVERDYKQGDDASFVTKTTNYTYRALYKPQVNEPYVDLLLPTEIEEVTGSGVHTKKEIKYIWGAGPLSSEPKAVDAYNLLLSKGVIAIPEATYISVKNPGKGQDTYQYVSQERTEFIKTEAGNVEEWKTFVRRSTEPGTLSAGWTKISEKLYNEEGLMAAQSDEGDRTIAYLLDYDNQSTVSSAINVRKVNVTRTVNGVSETVETTETVACNSFETDKRHGFTYNGIPVAATSVTGNRYYPLTGANPVSATINSTARPYTLSLWSTAAVSVSGSTLQKTGPARKGFTYYEYALNAGTSVVNITGTANVDEVRLYPRDARVSTVTYDPLIGKTSECDPNNRFSTYEYDSRAKVRLVRDDKGDIVKMYEYNEKRDFERCPSSYSSHAIYQIAQRTNCTGDNVGGYWQDTLAAGAYVSSISQLDADLKAQLIIDARIQGLANTNAPCIPFYKSDALSQTFYKENCPPGQEGLPYTYTVPANKYISFVSKNDANDMRDEDIADNGQDMANQSGGCTTTTLPQWESDATPQLRCTNGKTEVRMKNINPGSSTYNQYQWFETEEDVLGCTPPESPATVIGTNSYLYPSYTVAFSNNITGSQTVLTLDPSSSNSTLGQIPPGIYTVEIFPNSSSVSYSWSIGVLGQPPSYNSGYGGASSMVYGLTVVSADQVYIYIESQN